MTPEEIQQALNQLGMAQAVAKVSGYSDSHITDLKNGRRRFTKHSAKVLMDSIPRAREIVQANGEALYYHGETCVTCGSTMRYAKTKRCVPCNRRIRGAAYAAARRAAK